MKFECKCGNVIQSEHGKYDIFKEGITYILFYCTECKSMIKIKRDASQEDAIYGYTLEDKTV